MSFVNIIIIYPYRQFCTTYCKMSYQHIALLITTYRGTIIYMKTINILEVDKTEYSMYSHW